MFKTLRVPESNDLHISFRHPGGREWRTDQTACLMEAEEGERFKVVEGDPTCPFCIRDAAIPEELKPALRKKAGL